MAKPIKKNGKWGTDVEAYTTPQGYAGTGDQSGDWNSTGPDIVNPGGWQEFDAPTQASLELASSRYGVPEDATQAAASNAKWDEQAKANEGLRGSALSMANTFAQSAAMTRAREAEGTSLGTGAEGPAVTLKKKGAPQPTSAKFRI
jgi:hypothetical protein